MRGPPTRACVSSRRSTAPPSRSLTGNPSVLNRRVEMDCPTLGMAGVAAFWIHSAESRGATLVTLPSSTTSTLRFTILAVSNQAFGRNLARIQRLSKSLSLQICLSGPLRCPPFSLSNRNSSPTSRRHSVLLSMDGVLSFGRRAVH